MDREATPAFHVKHGETQGNLTDTKDSPKKFQQMGGIHQVVT